MSEVVNQSQEIRKVAFVGTGVMGTSMIRNLMKAGYEIAIYTRRKEKAEILIQEGVEWHDSIEELAQSAEVFITMLGYPHDVEEVYLSDQGLLTHASQGSLFIDMTTSSPLLAEKINRIAQEKWMTSLDAPVSGGDIGARDGLLSIMVGGSKLVFNRALPLFQAMGKNIIFQGPAGSGQHAKMSNQIAVAPIMLGVCESLAYAKKAGLDPDTVLQSIANGAAGSWTMTNLAPRMLAGNFDPGFFVKHFIKDMDIALASAQELGIELPGLALAEQRYQELAQRGGEDFGTHALFKLYE